MPGVWTMGQSWAKDFPKSGFVTLTVRLSSVFYAASRTFESSCDFDGGVDIIDFLTLLADWGPCPCEPNRS